MARYVALLRGINVGGNNMIRMADLKACFEADGLDDVATYIQSGNVVFSTARSSEAALTERVERMLGSAFSHYRPVVVVRSRDRMRAVVDGAPAGFGVDRAFRYDVIFLKPPLSAGAALRDVPMKEGVDSASAGKGVLYYRRLESRVTQSRISRVVATPMYQSMTIRNWNTTTRLFELLDAPVGA